MFLRHLLRLCVVVVLLAVILGELVVARLQPHGEFGITGCGDRWGSRQRSAIACRARLRGNVVVQGPITGACGQAFIPDLLRHLT